MAFLRNEFTPINGAYIHYIKEIEPDRKGWNFAPEWMKPMSGLSGENAPDYSTTAKTLNVKNLNKSQKETLEVLKKEALTNKFEILLNDKFI